MWCSFENNLENRVRKLFSGVILENHNLDKLFKTSLVSIPDDELMENKLNKFYDKIKEPNKKLNNQTNNFIISLKKLMRFFE